MDKNDLKVLRGGLLDSINTSKKVFIKATATNTRLMGVTFVHAIYNLPENFNMKYAHLFFYFDSDEFFFDSFEIVPSSNLNEPLTKKLIQEIIEKMSGGLGGIEKEITEKELIYLVTYYANKTKTSKKYDLPDNFNYYSFLIDDSMYFSKEELSSLYDKITEEITSNYQLVHYFLMRTIGRDYNLSNYLSDVYIKKNILPFKNASLIKNNIINEKTKSIFKHSTSNYESLNTHNIFFSESLIETNNNFFILTSSIEVYNKKVQDFKVLSIFKISDYEVSFKTKRPEYIALYQLEDILDVDTEFKTNLLKYSTSNLHDNGIVYMIFNKDNSHVKKKNFDISDDLLGSYYISDYGELLIFSYVRDNMKILSEDILTSSISSHVKLIDTYEFVEPIFYSFIESNYPDFRFFLEDFNS